MAWRRAKAAGVALGLLAGLGGGLLGYRSYALRTKAPAAARAQGQTGAPPATLTAAAPSTAPAEPDGSPGHPGDSAAPPEGTPAEREARLLARLGASAREAELLRRVGDGLLPAAARPLVELRPKGEPLSPAIVAQAESIAHDRAMAEERRAREAAWPSIQEAEPPPGPIPAAARPPPPKRRPPRLELPARLDQWGE